MKEKIKELPLHPRVHVLGSHDIGFVALEKPEGIKTHPNGPEDQNTSLLRASYDLKRECYHWETGVCWVLHRLDSPTSGIVLIGVGEKAKEIGRKAFASGTVRKVYYALVKGSVFPLAGTWVDRLEKEKKGNFVRVKRGNGVLAKTRYKQLEKRGRVSLLQLIPETGRTHQLRVQCALRMHPVVGDRTYGDFAFNREWRKKGGEKRLFLHEAELVLSWEKGVFSVVSTLPECFKE